MNTRINKQQWQEEEALRRFQLISPLLQADLDDAKRIQLRKKIAEENHISVRSLYRYEKAFSERQFTGLKPADREKHRSQKLPENFEFLLEQAIQLRKEVPERSVAQIIYILETEGLAAPGALKRSTLERHWSYVKKKYKLNVTNFLCSERSLTCYFYCILLDVFKILFLIFIWRQISTMTVNAHGIVKCFDVFKNQFMCMCIIKDFKPVDPFSLQKCMERFYTGVIPWICFL